MISISLACTFFLIQWCWTSMRFLCAWKTRLFISFILFSLLQCNYVGSSSKNCSSFNKVWNQVMFLAPLERDLYSNLMLDKTIVGWHLFVQDKRMWLSSKNIPIVDLQLSRLHAQSTYTHHVSLELSSQGKKISNSIVLLTYWKICLVAFKWDSWGLFMNLLNNMSIRYAISSHVCVRKIRFCTNCW